MTNRLQPIAPNSPWQGQLLAAAPHVVGLPQARNVVLILQHGAEGAGGVVLTHPVNQQLHHACCELIRTGHSPESALRQLLAPPSSPAHLNGPQPEGGSPADPAVPQESETSDELSAAAEFPPTAEGEPQSAGPPAPANQPPAISLPVGVIVAPGPDGKTPAAVRPFVGQVVWPAGQLEKEVQAGLWMTLPGSPELIFGEHEDLWQETVRHVGSRVLFDALGVRRSPVNPWWN